MNVLIINTAAEKPYVSLYQDKQRVGHKTWSAEAATGLKLLERIEGMLKKSGVGPEDINRIAVHGGPGARSSHVRVGVVVASMLSLTKGAEIVNISGETETEVVEQAMDKAVVTAIIIKYKERGYGQNREKGANKNCKGA